MKDFDKAELTAVNKGLLEPVWDLLDRGGKRWRPVLGMVFAECYGRNVTDSIEKGKSDNDDVLYACGLTEIVHNGSLMVDDLEDKSLKRRGEPCTYLKYGEDYAVNAGTLMYYSPIFKLEDFISDARKREEIVRVHNSELFNLHFGQNWDIHWHNGKLMPTEEQYLQMVINKTSVLPRLCASLISIIVGVDQNQSQKMCEFIESLGAAFQIQDDLIAVISEDYVKERGILGEDIHEGKRTLMVINSCDPCNKRISDSKKQRLIEILNMRTTDELLLTEAIEILHQSGSITYAQDKAKHILISAWQNLEKSLPSGEGKNKLQDLSKYLIDRDL